MTRLTNSRLPPLIGDLQTRIAVLVWSLGITIILRAVGLLLGKRVLQAGLERTERLREIDDIGGRAFVGLGSMNWYYAIESAVGVLHILVALRLIIALRRLASVATGRPMIDFDQALSDYFRTGIFVAVVAAILTFGVGILAVVAPLSMGMWGILHVICAVATPVAVWRVNRRDLGRP